jgi:LuxR family maltose regulon positive regulatory protein
MTGTMSELPAVLRRVQGPGHGTGRGGNAEPGRSREPGGGGSGLPHLLEDKLWLPQPNFPVLSRPRVTRLIERAAQHRVAVISGPAGAGKTVACASWAAGGPDAGRVVWLTLEAEDRQDWFWMYVCVGLNRMRPGPAETLQGLEDSSPDAFPLRLVEAAQAFTVPVVLVLDDIHELTDPGVLNGLDVLIRHAPPTLRLVMLGRRQPALQLARLRVAGELADIGGPDLACTAEEADAYFSMLGIDVAADERDEVLRSTEGWMAGLRLAAMGAGAGSRDGARVTGLAGDEPLVTDYLRDEVLAPQEPQIRAFLLRTSLVPAVCGDLADALTGQVGSVRTLERLSRENSFVEALDRGGGDYRYHPLLRDVLSAELHREIPQEIPVLLRRAARWYADHGRTLDAVRSAATGQDWDYAARALARSGMGVVMSADPDELESVLALIPTNFAVHDAAVSTAWAGSRLWRRDPEGAAAYLDSAARALEQSSPALRRITEPTLMALRILHAAEQDSGNHTLTRQGRSLADSVQAAVSTQAEHRAVGLLWFSLGIASLRRWEIAEARRALWQADHQLGAGGLPDLRWRARAWRALAEACSGDLVGALQTAGDVRRGTTSVMREASCLADLAYAQVRLARDDLETAQRLLTEVDPSRAGHLPGEPPVTDVAALMQARILLADGDAAAARAVLSRLRETWARGRPALSQVVTVAEAEAALRAGDTGRARALLLLADEGEQPGRGDITLVRAGLLLAEGDFGAALELVSPLVDGVVPGTGQERIAALLVAAVARRRLGAAHEAAALVEQALELAEPQRAYRVFLDGGPAVRSAVTVLVPPTSRNAGLAGRVLERFDAQSPRLAPPAGQANVRLTDSERAVLCFLPSHMTNEEISQALFLSINTVKTHLRSVYRKLGVGSRREAIARGRRMGLL